MVAEPSCGDFMAYNDHISDTGASGQPPITRTNILDHLTEMIGELKVLAGAAEAPLLASILDLAQQEARSRSIVARQLSKFNS